MKFKFRSLNH